MDAPVDAGRRREVCVRSARVLVGYARVMRVLVVLPLVAVACSSSPLPTEQSPAPSATGEVDYAVLCPVLADTGPIGGTPASLVGDSVTTDLARMRTAIPSAPGGWTVDSVQDIPRGMAGHGSSSVAAMLSRGTDRARIEVLDLVHVCRCQAGDGIRLRAHDVARTPTERTARELGGWPALTEERAGGGATVKVWVSDRCLVSVDGALIADLVPIAESLGWDAIASACGPTPR